jgi:hypothetical protein
VQGSGKSVDLPVVRPRLHRYCERQRSNPVDGVMAGFWIASSLSLLAMTLDAAAIARCLDKRIPDSRGACHRAAQRLLGSAAVSPEYWIARS